MLADRNSNLHLHTSITHKYAHRLINKHEGTLGTKLTGMSPDGTAKPVRDRDKKTLQKYCLPTT